MLRVLQRNQPGYVPTTETYVQDMQEEVPQQLPVQVVHLIQQVDMSPVQEHLLNYSSNVQNQTKV